MSEITKNCAFESLNHQTQIPPENAFNFLRLVCCIVVIYEHCVVLSGANLPCLNLRRTAVNVFFILSGFWVTLSYLKSPSIKKYAFKRFRKIFPEYWLVVVISALLLSFFSTLTFREYFSNSGFYKYLLANLLTLNFVHPTLPGVFENMALGGSVNGSLWTIKVELGFYIVLPVLIWIFRKTSGGGKYIVVISILYILSALYEVLMPFACRHFGLPSALSNQFPAFLSYFLSGMIFALFGENLFSKLKIIVVPCALFFIILNIFKIPFVTSLFSPFCLCVIVMFLGQNLKIFASVNRKPDYSYGLYLVHYPLVMIFTLLGVFAQRPIFAIFSVLGTSFLCAYLMERISLQITGNRQQRKEMLKLNVDDNDCLRVQHDSHSERFAPTARQLRSDVSESTNAVFSTGSTTTDTNLRLSAESAGDFSGGRR